MRNGECGMRNDTATLVAGNDPRLAIPHSAFRTPHSRTLSQPDAPIDGLERQSSPPAPDRAAQAAGAEPSRDHEGEIGLDVAVDRLGADLGGQRSEEHTSELQSRLHLVCRLLLEKKKKIDCNNAGVANLIGILVMLFSILI